MRKKHDERTGQIGEYWLSKKPGRSAADDAWCRTWYDERKRQTCRVSLGTPDFSKASLLLAEWVVTNRRTRKASPDQVLVETILLNYWNDHAQHLPSANTQRLGLSYWQEFWARCTVADITPQEQRRFREWLTKRGTGKSGVDRILSVGRAALNRARKWEELSDVPHIFGALTADAKRAREPKGRPVTPEELARLFDAARSRHMLTFLLIAANTMARPAAILDLAPSQFDADHHLLDLNPMGRTQNKKFRPIVPVTPTLMPWLEREVGPSGRYVNYRRKPVNSILHMWRLTRSEAGLDERVTPYSVRHGMARELRKRQVPTEQIGLFLGHLPDGSAATTSIYAPYEPDFLSDAVEAIESAMNDVRKHLKRAQIDKPEIDPADLAAQTGKRYRHGIGEKKREEVRFLILSGVSHAEVVRVSGVSSGTVSAIRQELKAQMPLYRNTEMEICVPFACRDPLDEDNAESQPIESIGGASSLQRTRLRANSLLTGKTTANERLQIPHLDHQMTVVIAHLRGQMLR